MKDCRYRTRRTGTGGSQIAAIFLTSLLASLGAVSCTTTTTTTPTTITTNNAVTLGASQDREEKPRGFFERISDSITERECKIVGRFTCPYGFGPANEPCECIEPDGTVRRGTTIK